MITQISVLLYLGTLCMIMVKDKLSIEHNIFHQVCFTLLRPEVGVAPQCVLAVADPGFGQGGGQEFFSEILPT